MKYLLLDIGNSNIKAGVSDNKGVIIHSIKRTEYNKDNFIKAITSLLEKYEGMSFTATGISLVDQKLKDNLSGCIAEEIYGKILFVDIRHNCGIKFKYENSLGADRVAAAAGAYFNYQNFNNVLIVDFGTATTYSLLSHGIYLGGIITPGFYISYNALIQNTALPGTELSTKYNILNSRTNDAIRSGILLNAKYSFEGIVSNFEKQYEDLMIIATGGASHIMKKISDKIELTDDNLVLKGILKILNYYN